MRTIFLLVVLALLLAACGEKVTPQEEPRVAIDKIKAAFDARVGSFGSTQGYNLDEAIVDADLDEGVLERWKFKVYGNPPESIVATSTDNHPSGKGKRVVYSYASDTFEGWMVDVEDEE